CGERRGGGRARRQQEGRAVAAGAGGEEGEGGEREGQSCEREGSGGAAVEAAGAEGEGEGGGGAQAQPRACGRKGKGGSGGVGEAQPREEGAGGQERGGEAGSRRNEGVGRPRPSAGGLQPHGAHGREHLRRLDKPDRGCAHRHCCPSTGADDVVRSRGGTLGSDVANNNHSWTTLKDRDFLWERATCTRRNSGPSLSRGVRPRVCVKRQRLDLRCSCGACCMPVLLDLAYPHDLARVCRAIQRSAHAERLWLKAPWYVRRCSLDIPSAILRALMPAMVVTARGTLPPAPPPPPPLPPHGEIDNRFSALFKPCDFVGKKVCSRQDRRARRLAGYQGGRADILCFDLTCLLLGCEGFVACP
ncbi:unnamed protein product, partial [Scytosiphon promiscuus]